MVLRVARISSSLGLFIVFSIFIFILLYKTLFPPSEPTEAVNSRSSLVDEAASFPRPAADDNAHNQMSSIVQPLGDLSKFRTNTFPFASVKSFVEPSKWYMTLHHVCITGDGGPEKVIHMFDSHPPKNWKDLSPPNLFTFVSTSSTAFTSSLSTASRSIYFLPNVSSYYLPNEYNIAHDLADSFIVMYDLIRRRNAPARSVGLVIHSNLRTSSWLFNAASVHLAPAFALRDPTSSADSLICFDRLTICSKDRHYISSPGLLNRFRFDTLRLLNLPDNRPNALEGINILVYTRANELRRRVLNVDALESVIKKVVAQFPNTHYTIHHIYIPGFRQQVELYYHTDILVGVTGGSQTNTVFMNAKTSSVVELLPCHPAGVSWLHFLNLWSVKLGNHLPLLNCPSERETNPECVKRFSEAKCANSRNFNFNVTRDSLEQMEQFLIQKLTVLHSHLK